MLSDNEAIATVAVKNLERAKQFYEGTLGLTKVMENEEVLAFKDGKSTLFVYRSQFAGRVLLQHLDRDRELFALGFADQKVYVLGHDYVTCNVEVIPLAGAFENF